jgi:hypothetical protein
VDILGEDTDNLEDAWWRRLNERTIENELASLARSVYGDNTVEFLVGLCHQ